MEKGTATVVGPPTTQMVTDGPCLSGTIEQLAVGVGARPMPRDALTKVRADALDLTGKVLAAYVSDVAQGEVGAGGSATASEAEPLSRRTPTVLLYGRIQSGKTVAMISFCAAAVDNGFRVVVVLTSDYVKLVEQTSDRFTALDGPLIKNALLSDNWDDDREHVTRQIAEHGVVFICTKNQSRLTALVEFLIDIGAARFPSIVLDDEADQATPDTTTAARSAGKKTRPPSAIHRRTVVDDEGQSIRQTLRHHVFVQVTATPYALLLQNVESDLRPKFTHLLEPGDGYNGGESFFAVEHVELGRPPLVSIEEDETERIEDSTTNDPPLGLQRALTYFLIAAGAQNDLDPASRAVSQNFLCHTSQKTADHAKLGILIRGYLNRIGEALLSKPIEAEILMRLQAGYDELLKTLPDAPAFDPIIEHIKRRLPRREVVIVNSANSSVEFGRQMNFIVGGNILGRGLTIDNLLVTYYLRRAKVSQMDTVLQHARMFGYRRKLMPYTRVFLPDSLGARFHFIHVAEQNLRQQLADSGGTGKIAVETMSTLRATRLNVLDTRTLLAYEGGEQVYPGAASFDRTDLERFHEIDESIRRVAGGTLKAGEFLPVSLKQIVELLPALPYNRDLGNMWDPEMLGRLLGRIGARNGDRGFVFYRTMQRTKEILPTGALSGPELSQAKALGAPVLCVFRDDGRALKTSNGGRLYWYPTMVFPEDMPTQLFNTTG
jgi:hypothetical protein